MFKTALQHEAGVGDILIADAMCFLFCLISDACFRSHFKSKFISLLLIVLRCSVKNTSEYLHPDITCLMDRLWENNANKSLASGKFVANSLTLTTLIPWTGETAGHDQSECANHNHV